MPPCIGLGFGELGFYSSSRKAAALSYLGQYLLALIPQSKALLLRNACIGDAQVPLFVRTASCRVKSCSPALKQCRSPLLFQLVLFPLQTSEWSGQKSLALKEDCEVVCSICSGRQEQRRLVLQLPRQCQGELCKGFCRKALHQLEPPGDVSFGFAAPKAHGR